MDTLANLLNQSPGVLWTLGGIGIVLSVATVFTHLFALRRGRDQLTEVRLRIRSWWVIVVLFTVSILLPIKAALGFFAFVSFLALKEYLSIIPTRRADRRVLFWAYLAIPIQFVWIGVEWYNMFLVFIPIYMFLWVPMSMVLIGQTEGFLRAAGTLNWGLMICVFGLSHLAYLLVIPPDVNPQAGGAGMLLFLVLLTQANDIAQFLWGKSLGRHKIIPSVSPNKTWEGFLGGVVTTIVLSLLLAPVLTPFSYLLACGAGILIGIGGFLGDVTISAVKRDLKIKDSGTLLPGHGGILDRVDSLTYTAPVFFHFFKFFYF